MEMLSQQSTNFKHTNAVSLTFSFIQDDFKMSNPVLLVLFTLGE